MVSTIPDYGRGPSGDKPALTFVRNGRQYQLSTVWESRDYGRDVVRPVEHVIYRTKTGKKGEDHHENHTICARTVNSLPVAAPHLPQRIRISPSRIRCRR